MAIYVDPLQLYGNRRWCHLVTDGPDEELHEFAKLIGVKRSWFQTHRFWSHYDLTPGKRTMAIRFGAIPVSSLSYLARTTGKVK